MPGRALETEFQSSGDHPLAERVAHLESWSNGHESRCEDRQSRTEGLITELRTVITDQKSSIQWVARSVAGLVISMLVWSLAELYKAQTAHPIPVQAAPPTIIYAPPGQPPVVVNPVQGQAATSARSLVPEPPATN